MIKPIKAVPDIAKRGGGGCHQRDLSRFLESGQHQAEVVIPTGRKPYNIANAIAGTIKKGNYPVVVVRRQDRVFIQRKEKP